ncbi:S41 family peptidase [Hyphobacterium indicum]|uniref:S41 family peptidase n=1 Tax=Hyphobacterium indicum TaxID=2162714 RepID=UPI000D65B301|nr:S41 family peptidase [Hyphobacterium indicum]
MKYMITCLALLGVVGCAEPTINGPELENGQVVEFTVSTSAYGELTALLDVVRDGNNLQLRSRSNSSAYLATLPTQGSWFSEGDLLVMEVRHQHRRSADECPTGNIYAGRLASFTGNLRSGFGRLRVCFDGESIVGDVADGHPFSGHVSGRITSEQLARDYAYIRDRIDVLLEQHLFDPRLIAGNEFERARAIIDTATMAALDDFDFSIGYMFAETVMPFSHFQLYRPDGGLDALLQSRAARGVQGEALSLEFDGGIAILTVDSFLGEHIGGQIDDAFAEIIESGADKLIVDLRANSGGSTAGAVLANHLAPVPGTVGAFVSADWYAENNHAPTARQISAAPEWQGGTLDDFYAQVEREPIFGVAIQPSPVMFDGEIIVLIGPHSSSMTELVAAALREFDHITLVGETTAGEMLSSRFFDAGGGYVVRIPVADYFTRDGERIEGNGVEPEVEVPVDDAMGRALEMLR